MRMMKPHIDEDEDKKTVVSDDIQVTTNDNAEKTSVRNQRRKKFKSMNSWNVSQKRRSIKLLGIETKVDKNVIWRVKWGQYIAALSAFLSALSYTIATSIGNDAIILRFITIAFLIIAISCNVGIYYNNFSFAILKRLCTEQNVIFILLCSVCNLIINIVNPTGDSMSWIFGMFYLVMVIFVITLDAVMIKSRGFVIGIYSIFMLLHVYLIYQITLGTVDNGVKLATYHVQGEEVILWRRSAKRLVYVQNFLFSFGGLFVVIKDKKMELMLFGTGQIYRDTGTGRKNIGGTNKGNVTRGKRRSVFLLGTEEEVDESLDWRLKRGQIGVAAFAFPAMILYLIAVTQNNNLVIFMLSFAFQVATILSAGFIFYKNISFTVVKRLLREPNVIFIFVCGVLNLFINIFKPSTSMSRIFGIVYLILIVIVIFMDAIKIKSRKILISINVIWLLLNVGNTIILTFGTADNNIKLFVYNIQNEEVIVWKRSIKRSIFLQCILFSLNGIWVMIKDKKMELMLFATDNIYRDTGTSSKYIEDPEFSDRRKRETESSLRSMMMREAQV